MYKGKYNRVVYGEVMEVLKIKDFAEAQGVSYEAIRRQVARYSEELEGHITTQGKTKYLDEYAVEFLSKRRKEKPVIVLQQNITEELEEAKRENDKLQKILLEAQQRIIELQEDNIKAIESKAKYEALLEDSQRKDTEIQEARKELSEVKIELSEAKSKLEETEEKLTSAEAEAQSYQKSIFGLYRKVIK